MKVLGIVLIILGALGLAYQGITYTRQEKVLDLGPLQATASRKETIPVHPAISGGALGLGVLLVLTGGRGSARR